MKALIDVGGTHIRIGVEEDNLSARIRKYHVADFPDMPRALQHYMDEEGVALTELCIATAAYEDGPVWRFVNQNLWVIDPAALGAAGWPVSLILNDFAAATWGLVDIAAQDVKLMRGANAQADNPDHGKLLCGPGTGLGLGLLYEIRNGSYHVQRTHGGHMPAAALSEEQGFVIRTVARQLGQDLCVFENLVSGPGLLNIYRALCFVAGKTPEAEDAQGVVALLDQAPEAVQALRLFHEFLGLFCANAVVTSHGYGGVYLTGGVMDRLMEAGLFDLQSFERCFMLPAVDSVRRDLQATPVYHVTNAMLAMKGLLKCQSYT